MKFLNLVLAAGALIATATPADAQTRAERDPARAAAGKLSAADVVSGFSGTANNFGRRADADGDLTIVADDLTAGVVSISNVAFESANLLSLVTIPNFTGVLDVAIEGDFAAVLVERSNGAESGMLYTFRRVILGTPVWLAAAQSIVVDDAFGAGTAVTGFGGEIELRNEVVVVAWHGDVGFGLDAVVQSYDVAPSSLSFNSQGFLGSGGTSVTSLAVGEALPFFGSPDEFGAVVGVTLPDGTTGVFLLTVDTSLFFTGLVAILQGELAIGTGYGTSTAVHGPIIVVGEPGADVGGTDTGAVRIYDILSSGSPIGTLISPTLTDGDQFGRSVAMNDAGDLIAIGERHNDAIVPTSSNSTGYVRFAVPNTPSKDSGGSEPWVLTHDVAGFGAPASGVDENLGADISFGADDLLIAGAPGTATLDGYVSWFFLPSAPWVEVEQSPALAGTPGLPEMHMEGAVFADGPIVVGVRNAQPSSTTFVIIGLSTLFAPAKGGIVYPSFDVMRMFPTNASGQFVVPTTWTADFAAFGPLDMHFQFWTLDPGGVSGFSATDGGVFHQY